ncbi:MAG: cysteine hydrolase [Lachnospiraceae bacterium]|nr:cysteine hydrolase [Lachnospiraceae bacterium]
MKKLLIVVDMQKDFVDGALANPNAQAIVPAVTEFVKNWKDDVLFTRDTHTEAYMDTLEGKKLPVIHCVKGTPGWEIIDELKPFVKDVIDKPVFGSWELGERIREDGYDDVTLIGVCTGICVISNAAIVRAANPETNVKVMKDLCACITPETHRIALDAMKTFQVDVL